MPPRPVRIALPLLATAACVSAAAAGEIRGRLWASREAARLAAREPAALAATGGRAARATHDRRLVRAQRPVAEAVVYIVEIPDKVERRLASRGRRGRSRPPMPVMVQVREAFSPRVVVVPAGDSVGFLNRDRIWHNAFSVSAARRFDTGKLPPGAGDTVTFQRPGLVTVHCDVHPEETGYVLVVPNRAWTRPDSLGEFRLPKLPAGRYQLRAWHPHLGELRRTADVPKRGHGAIELAF
uniref:Blue (type 1) copper domain-containing protein n=1 Tax=Eiseniibacteriota bacterium TaxID=2212470 RepID=A0A832I2M9_UNCEI